MLIFVNIAQYFHKLINLTVNTTGWSWGLASGAIDWSLGVAGGAVKWSSWVAGGAVGWTTCSDARVDGIVDDVAKSKLDTTLRGMVREGMDWSGRSGDVR